MPIFRHWTQCTFVFVSCVFQLAAYLWLTTASQWSRGTLFVWISKDPWLNDFQGTATMPPSGLLSAVPSLSPVDFVLCTSTLGFAIIREKPYPSDVPLLSDSCIHTTQKQHSCLCKLGCPEMCNFQVQYFSTKQSWRKLQRGQSTKIRLKKQYKRSKWMWCVPL